MKSKHAAEMSDLRNQLAEATRRLSTVDSNQQEELAGVFEHVGIPSTSGMSTLKRRISSLKTEATEEANRRHVLNDQHSLHFLFRRKLDAELDALRETLNSSNSARQEIARRVQDLSEVSPPESPSAYSIV